MRAWGVLAGVASLFALLPLSGEANAKQVETERRDGHSAAIISLGRSGGYSIWIRSLDADLALLGVSRESGDGYASTQFGVEARNRPEEAVVRARWPGIGAVDLRFVGDGDRHQGPLGRRCHGRRPFSEAGRFVGSVRLRLPGGESVRRRSVPGIVDRSFPERCPKSSEASSEHPTLTEFVAPRFSFRGGSIGPAIVRLQAANRTRRESLYLTARHYEGQSSGAEIQVGMLEGADGMIVGRQAGVETDRPDTLTSTLPGVQPAMATLRPGAPFQGVGIFEETSPLTNRWSGDLRVVFPDREVPVTGRRWRSALCVVSPLRTPAGCDFGGIDDPLLPSRGGSR